MTSLAEFDIRFSELDDLPFLTEWFSYPGACDPFPFGLDQIEEDLKNWIGFSRFNASLTGTLANVPCAVGTLFLMPYKKISHQCTFYLIVDPKHRGLGIGTSMIKNLLHLAKSRFKLEGVYVEVYKPNPIISLLEKFSFKAFVEQENFVHINQTHLSRVLLEYWFQ